MIYSFIMLLEDPHVFSPISYYLEYMFLLVLYLYNKAAYLIGKNRKTKLELVSLVDLFPYC